MARPYRDPVLVVVKPLPATSPLISEDARVVVGVIAPAATEPIPVVLIPGFEYRLREIRDHSQGGDEPLWIMERRRVGNHDA